MELNKKNLFKGRSKTVVLVFSAFVIGLIAGHAFFAPSSINDHIQYQSDVKKQEKQTLWTCSMHPQIKLPKPGKCPICSMDLIPLQNTENSNNNDREITISDYSAKLLELETTEVIRKFVDTEVRMVGKIDYDETKVSYISAWVPGRLDRLYVNYTGIPVKKGDHMADIYSPDLLTAQEELIQALKTVKELSASESQIILQTAETTVDAAREKLRLFGLSPEQIKQIEQQKKTRDHITINAPISGIVIHKNGQEGMYVKTGTRIYTIADISTVWVKLEAYESDLQWIRYGAEVEFTIETYPGRIFKGVISFVDPIIDPKTRTANVRVIVPNESLILKPGMFVRAVVRSKVAADGQIMNRKLAGKWISPMHPEIIKNEPGICDVCGMPLVSAESLGYVTGIEQNAPLVIPVSAAMRTGKRAVVYVEVPDRKKPTYEGREIVLGARLGDYYIVQDGLTEGERVVTRGAFKLDAELQIQAKPSMMSDTSESESPQKNNNNQLSGKMSSAQPLNINSKFRLQLTETLEYYFKLQQALAGDDPQSAKKSAGNLKNSLAKIDMALLKGHAHMMWMDQLKKLNLSLDNLSAAESIGDQRKNFAVLSNQLIITIKKFPPSQGTIYKASCPMAFDNHGASWLQDTNEIANPYFGKMMSGCGSIDEEINLHRILKGVGNEQ